MMMEIWDIWYPKGGAQGLSLCRARVEQQDVVWLHAATDMLRVEVVDDDGRRLALGDRLERAGKYFPMTKLVRDGDRIVREDGWPGADDIGRVVLLPGGEAGVLTAWWNADDGSEWRWSVEFYNKR
jgi:hypothetical protein